MKSAVKVVTSISHIPVNNKIPAFVAHRSRTEQHAMGKDVAGEVSANLAGRVEAAASTGRIRSGWY